MREGDASERPGVRIRLTAVVIAALCLATSLIATTASPTGASTPPESECLTQLPRIGAKAWAKVGPAKQLVVVRGLAGYSDENTFERWELQGSCWVKVSAWWSLNGYSGWHDRPWTGSLRSPIGVFGLTDTGGRLRNPGTTMRYHWGPGWWHNWGYRIQYPVQLYNYVIAINYNRRVGEPPRDERQPNRNTGSGYWIHQRGLGSTRGCVSLTNRQLVILLKWLKPHLTPKVIMGPPAALLR